MIVNSARLWIRAAAPVAAAALLLWWAPTAHAAIRDAVDKTVLQCTDGVGGEPATCVDVKAPKDDAKPHTPTGGGGGVTPNACPTDDYYSYSSVVTSAIAHATVYGQAGVTLTISEASGTTITGTVGGSGTFSVNAIVAGAQAQVNASISYAKTTTVTRGGSWTVPSTYTKVGALSDGAQTRYMHWTHYRDNANCTTSTLGSGTTNLPTLAPYIYHN